MLPTKGYFQDIECPYFNSSCGRPYCHFRHRKKPSEHVEEVVEAAENEAAPVVPTYKPTPKSQLANIHNNRSHIPISYVPDLAFRPDKKFRSFCKTENPTYNPTPLSILSSVNRNYSLSEENKEHIEAINEIKQNIANVEYDPTISLQPVQDINFEDLSNEFDLIDEIINSSDKTNNYKSENLDLGYDGSTHKKTAIKDVLKQRASISDNQKEQQLKIDSKNNLTNNPTIKTEKSSSKLLKEVKEKESSKESNKSNEKNKSSSESNKKESNHHKKNKKDKNKSLTQDTDKNKVKHSSKEKLKIIEKDSKSKKDKKECKDKDKHDISEHSVKLKKVKQDSQDSSKQKDKDKHKNKEKSTSEVLKEKRHSSDRTNHTKDKEKSKSRERSSSKSKDYKSNKKSSKERSPNRSREHKNTKKDKRSSKERSRSRSKECRSSKDEEKKRKRSSKDKTKKEKEKSKHDKLESDIHRSIPSNNSDIINSTCNDRDIDINQLSDSDVEANEDETMLECYRIFNEYKPQDNTPTPQSSHEIEGASKLDIIEYQGKKRIAHANFETLFGSEKLPPTKSKSIQTPGQILANRYKLAKQAQANREQELLMNEVQHSVVTKRPPPSLLEAARERKKMREMEKPKSTNLIDDILKGSTAVNYSAAVQKMVPKKIAPVHNVLAITKAKERISLIQPATQLIKTIAQTQKGNRIAHIPDVSLSDIPDVLQADKSKLPVNVRTRFLTMIADECVKMYISKEEAYSRALKEEFQCYEKCKVLTTYRNSAMLSVNRLRKEIQERNKTGLGLIGVGEDAAGHSGQSTSIRFYNQIKNWVLTEEELDIHGYPRQTEEYGVAVIKNFKSKLPSNLDENQRVCSRCRKLYQVDDDGWPLYEEECCYHPMKKRTIRGEQTYLCCKSSDETGCATSDTHVFDGFISGRLEGFQTTMDSEFEGDSRSNAVYALDCEMCYTTKGLELTRVTIVDGDCKTVYESLVKPLNPIIDYNTRFSGITKEQMDKTSTSILQVQANILHLCNSMTILVGHSLESDMKALKIVHGMIVDTSVLFPHKMGLPHKRALRVLASEYLRKIIQNDVSGHDSAEDAITCMELLKWKLKEDSKGKHA